MTSGTAASPAASTRAIAAILEEALPAANPGAAVIVVKDGAVIFRAGYGMANLELGIGIEPHMVFRLGSITKQFTAVAILILAQEGKLSLEDEITRFLPEYPTQGHRITVEHLLTHTSGVKSYTSIPEWLPMWRTDLSLGELIDIFKDQPMDFAPGERWAYSNSGYVLLGAIIEQASGQSYERFLDTRIFQPLGMTHSCYDSTTRIIPGRVPGYQKGAEGLENAPYLSMTQPHAAGALLSSVDDLARWDAALYTDNLVSRHLLARAFTPFALNNGVSTGYGYGWTITEYEGHTMIEHGGGIPGFLTYAIRLPEERVFVAVLMNSTAGEPLPEPLAVKIAAEAIGHPYREPEAVRLDAATLDAYTGVYEADAQDGFVVTREEERLFVQRTGGSREEIFPENATQFFVKGSFNRLAFDREGTGPIAALRLRGRYGPAVVAAKTDKPVPHARQAIALDPALYPNYIGQYEIGAGFVVTISRDGEVLTARVSGEKPVTILPESNITFFVLDVDAQIAFELDDAGEVTGLVFQQGAQRFTGKKIA